MSRGQGVGSSNLLIETSKNIDCNMKKHKKHHCMNCKKLFLKCLLDIYPNAVEQYKNPLPKTLDKLSSCLIKIHDTLINHSKKDNRGPNGIILSKVFRPYDYFLPKYNCFV